MTLKNTNTSKPENNTLSKKKYAISINSSSK